MYFLLTVACLIVTALPPLDAESPVSVHPPNPVAALGGNISLTCHLVRQNHGTFQNITWLINGSTLDRLEINTQYLPGGVGIGIARFSNLGLEYNHTTIVCRGLLTSGRIFNSNGAHLLLQGTLEAVKSLTITSHGSNVSLTWIAPFTLNIHGLAVDITYSLNVISVSSPTLQMVQQGLIRTEYNHTLPNSRSCDNLVFTVTPVNGAGEGIPRAIPLSQAIESSRLVKVLSPTLRSSAGTNDLQDALVYHFLMSSLVCTTEVTLADKVSGDVITLHDMDLNFSSTLMTISFTGERLLQNRQYVITVNASNINGSETSVREMSTYDVVKSEILVNHTITTEYLPHSNAAGVLYGFFQVGKNGIDFTASTYLVLSQNASLSYELPSPLSPGVYYAHTYVIERDGLLNCGDIFPATTQVFSSRIEHQQDSIIHPRSSDIRECDISTSGLIISVLCFYSVTSSQSGFLLVVKEKSADGVGRLLVNTTEPGQPQGPVTVQVAMGGTYQATVFPVSAEMGILNSSVAYTREIECGTPPDVPMGGYTSPPPPLVSSQSELIPIIIGVGISLAVLGAMLGVLFLVVQCHRSRGLVVNKKQPETYSGEKCVTHTAVLESQGPTTGSIHAYEEISDVKNSFSYTQNVLYGQLSTTTSATYRSTSLPTPELITAKSTSMTSNPTLELLTAKSTSMTSLPTPELLTSSSTSDPVPEVPSEEEYDRRNAQTNELIQTVEYERMAGSCSVQQTAAIISHNFDSSHYTYTSCDSNRSHDFGGSHESSKTLNLLDSTCNSNKSSAERKT